MNAVMLCFVLAWFISCWVFLLLFFPICDVHTAQTSKLDVFVEGGMHFTSCSCCGKCISAHIGTLVALQTFVRFYRYIYKYSCIKKRVNVLCPCLSPTAEGAQRTRSAPHQSTDSGSQQLTPVLPLGLLAEATATAPAGSWRDAMSTREVGCVILLSKDQLVLSLALLIAISVYVRGCSMHIYAHIHIHKQMYIQGTRAKVCA